MNFDAEGTGWYCNHFSEAQDGLEKAVNKPGHEWIRVCHRCRCRYADAKGSDMWLWWYMHLNADAAFCAS